MTTNVVLPPGVSQQLFNALPKAEFYFDGAGQAGNWADSANWWKGTAPTTTSFVLIPVSTTLNGSFSAHSVMALGTETLTINGTLTTLDPNPCESFMVCDDAVAIFNPGSALNAAGAMIVGFDDVGTLLATGTASQGTTLSSLDGLIGNEDQGVGSVTLNDAKWNVSTSLTVGVKGTGTLSLTNGSVVSALSVQVGARTGSVGNISLSNGGTLNAASNLSIGSNAAAANGSGSGTVTLGAASVINVGSVVAIHANESLVLAGGSLVMGANSDAVNVMTGGTLSGYGTVSALAGGISDNGTIVASGGTLVLDGNLHFSGVLAIGNASTAFVNGAGIGHIAVEFTGTDGALQLATGISSDAKIYDFAAGDSIVMAGVNGVSFNAQTDVLTLKNAMHTVDKLQFVGSYVSNQFTISQSAAGAVIGLTTNH